MNTMQLSMPPAKTLITVAVLAIIAVCCFLAFRPSTTASHSSSDSKTENDSGEKLQQSEPESPRSGSASSGSKSESRDIESTSSSRQRAPPEVVRDAGSGTQMVDVRSDGCRKRRYRSSTSKYSASLVIDFSGTTDLNQLKLTVDTLLAGAEHFIADVVLVGDATATEDLLKHVEKYTKSLQVSSAHLIRNGGPGSVAARVTGYRKSKSEIVVFADSSVIGTVGWLKPLISALLLNPSHIIVPHYDDATNPAVFVTTSDRTVAQYTWPLTSRIMERLGTMPNPQGHYKSPLVPGNIFAVRRIYFDQIGGYDNRFPSNGVAAHMELSFRSWLCGAAVTTVACSHVAIRNVYEPVKVKDRYSVGLIGDLWFGDRKEILMATSGLGKDEGAENKAEHIGPKSCKNIDVFFSDVARVPVPSAKAVYFGQLQAKTDRCAHAHIQDNRIDLSHCWPAGRLNLTSMVFELTASGRLMTGSGRCLTVQRNSYILLDACTATLHEQQRWTYDGMRLINPWSNFCAMHVTDPENQALVQRQIVMAQNCTADLVQMKMIDETSHQFLGWKFVNL